VEQQRLEIESEAWYRAVAEGRLTPASDLAPGLAASQILARGSNASRNPSPNRLNASVVSRMQSPGHTISQNRCGVEGVREGDTAAAGLDDPGRLGLLEPRRERAEKLSRRLRRCRGREQQLARGGGEAADAAHEQLPQIGRNRQRISGRDAALENRRATSNA
jgi:hypothetical protein